MRLSVSFRLDRTLTAAIQICRAELYPVCARLSLYHPVARCMRPCECVLPMPKLVGVFHTVWRIALLLFWCIERDWNVYGHPSRKTAYVVVAVRSSNIIGSLSDRYEKTYLVSKMCEYIRRRLFSTFREQDRVTTHSDTNTTSAFIFTFTCSRILNALTKREEKKFESLIKLIFSSEFFGFISQRYFVWIWWRR